MYWCYNIPKAESLSHVTNPIYHGTILRTGMTYKKTLCYMVTQLEVGVLLKMQKYFEAMLKIFEFSRE